MITKDIWSEWLLYRRHGGDTELRKRMLDSLYPVREKVLENAELTNNSTLLDVGCGDGLIAFGALESIDSCQVIFSDVSQDLLGIAKSIAREIDVLHRCTFLNNAATDLSAIASSSVDAVTTRSVLIYVKDKFKAFQEFHRVLKKNGRLSIFEPVNSFAYPEPPHILYGIDVTPIFPIAQKIKAVYNRIQPSGLDPMIDFSERDLVKLVEKAGFHTIQLEFQATVKPAANNINWETMLKVTENPKIPSLKEILVNELTADQAREFEMFMRPRIEANKGISRSAVAYLKATK